MSWTQKLTVRALRYALFDGILYKKSFLIPYLKCLRPLRLNLLRIEFMRKFVDITWGRGKSSTRQDYPIGFLYSNMLSDSKKFVKRHDWCQRHVPIVWQLPESLKYIKSLNPFSLWGVDIHGPYPIVSAQRKFLKLLQLITSLSG